MHLLIILLKFTKRYDILPHDLVKYPSREIRI